jgi:hypothetical protein
MSKRWTEITTVDHLMLDSPFETTQTFQGPSSRSLAIQFLHLFGNLDARFSIGRTQSDGLLKMKRELNRTQYYYSGTPQ